MIILPFGQAPIEAPQGSGGGIVRIAYAIGLGFLVSLAISVVALALRPPGKMHEATIIESWSEIDVR